MSIDLTQHELAVIQSPLPSCDRDQISFPRDIAPYWRNHLHVYTAATFRQNTYLEWRSKRQDANVTAFLVPKFFVFDRKCDSSEFVTDAYTGHFAAIKAALRWLSCHSEHETFPKVVIFTPSARSLSRIGALFDKKGVQDDEQEFLDDLTCLTKLGTTVAFAWIPPTSNITPYKFVAEYSKAWFSTGHLANCVSYHLYYPVREEPCKAMVIDMLSNKSNLIFALAFQKWKCEAKIIECNVIAAAFKFPYPLIHQWTDHMFVYTNVTQIAPKKYETCVYIPELGKCFKKSNWMTVHTMPRASCAAVHFAMRVVSELHLENDTKLVFFTDNQRVLRILHKCEANHCKSYNHIIRDGIQCLRNKNINFSVAMYPPKSKCLLLKTVIEFYDESAPAGGNVNAKEFDTGLLHTFQSDMAWVQVPSSKMTNDTEHLFRSIPSLWPTYMHVYVADVDGDENSLVTSLYIPQLELYERTLKHRCVGNRKLAALHFAIQRIRALDIEERNVVIFSDSIGTLTNLISDLQMDPDKKQCATLIYEVEGFRKTGRKIAFSWIPEDESIAEYGRAVEFAKAWKYDDYNNESGCHWEDHLFNMEYIVTFVGPKNEVDRCTIKHELAWFQQPPKTFVESRSEYFLNEVLPYWQNSLHVYTNAVLEGDSSVQFTVSYYIPELNILQKKSKFMDPYDDNSAQMLALAVAMERLRTCAQRNFVFFNKSKTTLNAILYGLDHKNISTYAKDLVNSIRYLTKMKKFVAFAWIPPDLQIPQYKILVQYLGDPLEVEEIIGAAASGNDEEEEFFMEPAEEDDWMLVGKACERNTGEETPSIDDGESDEEDFDGDDYDFGANYFQGKHRHRCLMARVLL